MNGLDVYSVRPHHKAEAETEIRLCDAEWRKAGAISVSASQLEQAHRRAQQLQSDMDDAVVRSRPSRDLQYYRLVHLFARTGVRRIGKMAFVGLTAAVAWAVSLFLFVFVSPTFLSDLLRSLIPTLCAALMAITAAIGFWPDKVKSQAFHALNSDWLARKKRVESLRPVLQQAWNGYEALRGHAALFDRLEKAWQRLGQVNALLASAKYRLVHMDWRALRGVPFESFLSEVFDMLGYAVQTTKASGDQGVDLIAAGKGRRIAVQAKGYEGHVGNHAIMEVYTGMKIYQCETCVVITNSSFTRAATDCAQGVRCLLIDGSRIPDLIEGRIL